MSLSKKCSICFYKKTLDQFHSYKYKNHRHYDNLCKTCYNRLIAYNHCRTFYKMTRNDLKEQIAWEQKQQNIYDKLHPSYYSFNIIADELVKEGYKGITKYYLYFLLFRGYFFLKKRKNGRYIIDVIDKALIKDIVKRHKRKMYLTNKRKVTTINDINLNDLVPEDLETSIFDVKPKSHVLQ
jgi:hypothetical protein